ncbi:MAG: site-2 protease family protein [Planctomycetes bacterium]|nr:site-2 protease family protein [Planctomycetota bacterium]
MKWTYPLFRIFGIPLRLHVSFLLLLAILGISGLLHEGPLAAAIQVGAVVAVFAGVVLHELGHALVARAHHIPVVSITLYPIGGIARLREMPRKPAVELQVAAAGPAVSLALAGLAAGIRAIPGLPEVPFMLANLLFQANLILGLFNLLPGFPMDGGRILRSFLAMRRPYVRATEISARIGQMVAAGLLVFGILQGYILMAAVAVFIFFAAQAEYRAVAIREAFGDTIVLPGYDPVEIHPHAPGPADAPGPPGFGPLRPRVVQSRFGPIVFWGFFYEPGRDPRW